MKEHERLMEKWRSERSTSFLERLTLSWLGQLFSRGEALDSADDLPEVTEEVEVDSIIAMLEHRTGHLLPDLLGSFRRALLSSMALVILRRTVGLFVPAVLYLFIGLLEQEEEDGGIGYLLACALFLLLAAQGLLEHHYLRQANLLGLQMQASIMVSIFRKSMAMKVCF